MKKLAILAAGALALLGARAVEAHATNLDIDHAWARPAAAGKNAAIYLTIKNRGEESDRFVSADSPVAAKAELHETRDENGVLAMRALPDGIEIKPGSSIEFKPGSYHIMLFDLKQPLQEGATLPFTLTFEKAGTVKLEAKIEKTDPHTSDAHSHMGHAAH